MTIRFPESAIAESSATSAVNLLQDCTRTGVNQQLCETLTKLARLIGGASGALANVTGAVGRADDGVHGKFVAFETGPGTERNLAAALQCAEKSAFGDDGLARFVVVEGRERVRKVGVFEASLHRDCPLADGGHANVGRENFGDADTHAESIEAGFGENDGFVFAA